MDFISLPSIREPLPIPQSSSYRYGHNIDFAPSAQHLKTRNIAALKASTSPAVHLYMTTGGATTAGGGGTTTGAGVTTTGAGDTTTGAGATISRTMAAVPIAAAAIPQPQ